MKVPRGLRKPTILAQRPSVASAVATQPKVPAAVTQSKWGRCLACGAERTAREWRNRFTWRELCAACAEVDWARRLRAKGIAVLIHDPRATESEREMRRAAYVAQVYGRNFYGAEDDVFKL